MRKNEMRIGQQYVMQRGPTKRPHKVTLLAKDVPGANHRVMVRIEEGVSTGKEREVPSVSLSPLAGSDPVKPKSKKRPGAEPVQKAPPGWKPRMNEQVTWEQTLAIPMTVLEVREEDGIALIKGKVFGGVNRYDAPISQLCPVKPSFTPVDRLPARRREPSSSPASSTATPPPNPFASKPLLLEDDELVDRLTFAPELIAFYRNNFAKRKGLAQAEAQLRNELEGAQANRKSQRQYLTLTLQGKYEIVLWKRPRSDKPSTCYVRGISLLNKHKKNKAA